MDTNTTESQRIDRTAGAARDRNPGIGEQAGEAAGGIGGTLAGAALGASAGPIGMVLGGLAGAFGGWWAGEKAGRAAEDFDQHDHYYRGHFDGSDQADLAYHEAAVGYGIGHVAGHNPDYVGKTFDEIEADLRRGWTHDKRDFDTMRPFVRAGYDRTRPASTSRDPELQ